MAELADARYVGKSAMVTLREYVIENALGGPWDTCDTSDDCQDGLVCMGEIAWGTGIYCVDSSMYGTFSYDSKTKIPDNGNALPLSGILVFES